MLVNAIKKEKKLLDNQGMRKGVEKGAEEIARMMLSNGEPIEKIIRYTGLPTAAIQKLKAGRHEGLASPEN